MTRRPVAKLIPILLVLTLVAAACVRGENGLVSSKGATITVKSLPVCPLAALDKATAGGKGPVKVELWHALSGKSKDEIEALGKAFNESQHKVHVDVRLEGADYDEVLHKYQAAIPSNQLPSIVYIEDVNLRLMIDTKTVLPAESCMKADHSDPGLLPAVRNYYTANGIFWPGYTNVSEPILYFNANQFTKAGLDPKHPPQTLDQLYEAAKKLKASGVSKPLAFDIDSWFIESWLNGANSPVVNMRNGREGNPTKATLENPTALGLFEWLNKMNKEGLLGAVSKTPGQIDHYLALATQKSAMVVETSTAATTIKAFLGGDDSGISSGPVDLKKLNPMAAPFPGITTPGKVRVSGGAFYMTNTVSPAQQAGAWAFMRYMQKQSSQVSWHLTGSYLPATRAAAADPKIQTFWRTDLAGKMLKVAEGELQNIDPDNPGPAIGPFAQFNLAVQQALESMIFKGTSPQKALASAQKGAQAALDQYIQDNPGATSTTKPAASGTVGG